jgi:hypothetical protein
MAQLWPVLGGERQRRQRRNDHFVLRDAVLVDGRSRVVKRYVGELRLAEAQDFKPSTGVVAACSVVWATRRSLVEAALIHELVQP